MYTNPSKEQVTFDFIFERRPLSLFLSPLFLKILETGKGGGKNKRVIYDRLVAFRIGINSNE